MYLLPCYKYLCIISRATALVPPTPFFWGHVTGANGRGSLAGSTQKRAWRQNNKTYDSMYIRKMQNPAETSKTWLPPH